MKILIMVLSYNESPYKELMEAQAETWDSLEVADNDIKTLYYHGGGMEGGSVDFSTRYTDPWLGYRERVMFNCTDSYYYMAAKFKMALDYVKDWDYDIVFRTNSSSYVNKKKLKEFAQTLPKEKLYAGWTMTDSEDYGGLVVSGAGIFLSRDTAEILREKIDPGFEMEEDIYCGRILRKNGIVAIDDKSRYDVGSYFSDVPTDLYHYRFKTGDRLQDANNMRLVHKLIAQ